MFKFFLAADTNVSILFRNLIGTGRNKSGNTVGTTLGQQASPLPLERPPAALPELVDSVFREIV